ncbi:hypothetical protein Tco_1465331 [Tanacetum coccineum]
MGTSVLNEPKRARKNVQAISEASKDAPSKRMRGLMIIVGNRRPRRVMYGSGEGCSSFYNRDPLGSGFIRGPGDDPKTLAFSFHDKYKQGLMLSVVSILAPSQSRVKDRVRKSSSLQLCMQLNDLSPNFGREPVDSSKNDSGNIWDYSDNEAAPASSWSALSNMYELFFIRFIGLDSFAVGL